MTDRDADDFVRFAEDGGEVRDRARPFQHQRHRGVARTAPVGVVAVAPLVPSPVGVVREVLAVDVHLQDHEAALRALHQDAPQRAPPVPVDEPHPRP
ncbi:hypothetical protein [Actinomadura darangshiensis]|uniref:hypothetical protein n=1 Tax=Actinomadura darangshiensis TaxID=705336 RepID=UPI00140A3D45|nr:hypothetical protein [Actinomadura darangshiensis]